MRAWITVLVVSACGGSSPAPAPLPTNHPVVPAPAGPPSDAVLAWPVAPFTAAQVAEVKACDTEKLRETRYPKTLGVDALAGAYAVKSTCDRAILASACGSRGAEDAAPPASCVAAYRATVQANPAFAFANGLVGAYFGKVAIVAAPPIAQRKLASVAIAYSWSGLGTGVKWTVTAHDLASAPAIDIGGGKPVAWSAEVATAVNGLAASLGSFLPIGKPLEAIDCTDNYPDWTATLAFDDGSKLELFTKGSNLLGLGGPWQATIGGVTYLQLSPDFTRAIAKLVKTLGLAIGEPQGEFCRGFDLQAAVLQ